MIDSPTSPNRSPHVILYTRAGCHLCERAFELLARYGVDPQLVDIDQDPQLVERFTACVPVVVIDGVERFRGRVSELLLQRLLRHRPVPDTSPD